jgi:hypothetical protein
MVAILSAVISIRQEKETIIRQAASLMYVAPASRYIFCSAFTTLALICRGSGTRKKPGKIPGLRHLG